MKWIEISTDVRDQLKSILDRFESYSNFSRSKKRCYQYTKLIGVRVCPYCNINYIPTILDVTRPELDHFIAQSSKDGKDKQIDPDNLIPACHTCNSTLKGCKKFSRETHIHPFFDDFDSIVKFSINMTGSNIFDEGDFEILFTPISNDSKVVAKAKRNIKVFKLTERYANHKDIVINHFYLMSHYGKRKRTEILDLIGCHDKSDIYIDSLVNSYINSNINTTSLGKLIKDIYRTHLH